MELTSYISFISTGGTSSGYIPLDESIPLLLNFSLEDFKNPGNRSGSFSKPVKIPGSKEANILFGQIYAINSSDWTFNVNKKQSVIVYTNGVKVFKGYLQLKRINTKSETLNDAEQVNSYDCVIFDDRVNLYSELGSKQLTDFDFSQYNHVLNDFYTQETTGNTWQDAYVYPMYYGPSTVNYKTRDFLPSIFVRKYLEQMQIDNAFTFTGAILDDEQFVKMVMPYNGEVPKISEEDRLDRMFQASVSGDVLYTATRVANSNNYTSDNLTTVDWYYPFNFPTHPSFSTFGRVINYNNESDAGNFDTGGNYDNSLYRFTSPAVGTYDFNVAFVGLFRWDIGADDGWLYEDSADPAMSAGTPVKFQVRLVRNKALCTTKALLEANTVGWFNDDTSVTMPQRANIALSGPDVQGGSFYLKSFNFNQTFEGIQLGAGETLDVMFFTHNNRLLGATTYWDSSGHVGQATNDDNVAMTLSFLFTSNIGAVNRFKNTPHIGNINNGDNIYLNNFIPRQVSQKDLFASVVQMHNIYIQENPENEREIILKTRSEFYSSTTFSDWSDVFCSELEWNQVLLSELQSKRIFFQYREGKDPYNTDFKDSTGISYGTKEVVFDSELLQGDKKVEVIFEPTPIQLNGFGIPVSAIDSAAPKCGPRILYYEGMVTSNPWVYQGDFNVNQTKTAYAYAGHFGGSGAPYNPTYDLNWSINDYYYFPLETTYTNSLYDRYWDDYIDFIANGKLLTGYFKLTEKHINELDFGKKIWIEFFKSYFYVNKITDFNASKPGITKVELFKVYEGNRNRPRGRRGDTIYKPQGEVIAALDNQGGGTSGSQGGSATILQDAKGDNYVNTDGGGAVVGTGNEVSQTKGFIVNSDDNTILGADKSSILGGAGNTIKAGPQGATIIGGIGNEIYGFSSGATIIGGNNNYIDGDVSGVTIIGTSNLVITASTDSGTYIEGIKFKDGFVSGMTIDGYLPLTGGILTGGLTGTSVNFAGPIMSAGTDLYDIFATSVSAGQTFVQPGLNTYTGGTENAPTVNISGATLEYLSATTISGGTLYSGSTNLSSIFAPISVSGGTSGSLWSGSTGLNTIIANNGTGNLAEGNYSQVLGGVFGNAVLEGATVVTGINNLAYGQYCLIFGGSYNTALTINSVVVSGTLNKANANFSFIGAGNNNETNGTYAFVAAGSNNKANAFNSFVGGGSGNTVSGLRSAILNGSGNTVSGIDSAIIGGFGNSVTGNNSLILGGSSFTGTANSTIYVPNLEVRTNLVVTGTSNFASTVTAKGAVQISGNTSVGGNITVNGTATVTGRIDALSGISFTALGTRWEFKSVNIGGWDMDTTVSVSIAHGLSATEWSTIRNVDVMIFNDAQTNLYPLLLGDVGVTSGYHNGLNSTNISIGRATGGGFDSASYNDAGINRGFLSFWYIPD
jgi:hypothetical protein